MKLAQYGRGIEVTAAALEKDRQFMAELEARVKAKRKKNKAIVARCLGVDNNEYRKT